MTAHGNEGPPVRDAATVILYRNRTDPEVLMGQRGRTAVFMPSKFVFPGGAVEAGDAAVPLAGLPGPTCLARLTEDCDPGLPHALVAAAIREVWEETGLALGTPGDWSEPPTPDWAGFADRGLRPDGSALSFVFRAITPPGRPRRFDARFFLASADAATGDAGDFGAASDELSALQWIPLAEVRRFPLPFITEVVLAEIAKLIAGAPLPPDSVPFFSNDDEESLFRRLRGDATRAE